MKWSLLSVLDCKVSPQLVFSWLFGMIFHNLVVIPVWPWDEVNAASSFSIVILDLQKFSKEILNFLLVIYS